MKITHHKDGSYSITGMTRHDLTGLSFGAMLADHWFSSTERKHLTNSPEWDAAQGEAYRRLYTALEDSARSVVMADEHTLYLPCGRSITLTSDQLGEDRWLVLADGRTLGEPFDD